MKFTNIANQAEPDPETHFFRGTRYQIENDPANAIICYQKAVDLNPDFAEAYYNMGNAYQDLNMADQAIRAYKASIDREPDNINAYNNMGIIRQELGEPAAAMQCFQKALGIKPDSARTCYNMARLHREQGHLTESTWYYQKALKIQPDYAKAFNGLGIVLQEGDRFTCSITCFRKALKLKSDYLEAYFNMGVSFQKLGSLEDALRCYDKALKINPNFPYALWYYLLSLPTIYENADDIHRYRRRFEDGLAKLIPKFQLSHPDQKKAALAGVGSTTNFYLQYQGLNDLALQKKYGRYACNVMQANFPQWARPKQMPPRTPNERIRLGYVSSYMASHTVGKLFLGWVENANRHDFEIYCYHINKPTDQLTEQYKHQSDHFYHIYGDIEATARQIISDNLHILVFTDIGMYPPATQLAGLRLAPIQCTGWGHPVTTGLKAIDYYLSSDLMEPEEAQKYYSEKLIRLPHIALTYKKPNRPHKAKTRNDLGLKKNAFIYLCPQSLFKYLPQHDYIFPRIAQKVPAAQIVFIVNAGVAVSRKFRNRLARAFKEHGLELEKYRLFLPRLYHDDFMSLNLASDDLLDTLDWSGGHTTLEGISCGLPVVTLPGQFMRGRHAFAILKMMGITESIASDEKDYIDKPDGDPRQLNTIPLDKVNPHQVKEDRSAIIFKMGYQNQLEGHPDKAIICYREALKFNPNLAEANYNMGIAYLDISRIDNAMTCFKHAVKLKPDYVDAYNNLGNSHRDKKEFDKAIACYHKAIELNPQDPKLHYNLGNVYLKTDKPVDSTASFQKALALKPDYAAAYSSLGNAYEMLGHLDSAVINYRKAIDFQPDYAEAFFNLANALRKQFRNSAAVENYRQAIRLQNDYHDAYNNLGNLLKELGDLETAKENYRQAIRTKPDFPEAYYNLGNTLHQQGQIAAAIESFKQAIGLNPKHAEAHSNMGNAYKDLGRYKNAMLHYNQAIALKPDLAEPNFNSSIVFLLHQDFRRGWEGFEWRFKQANWKTIYPHRFQTARWDGSSFKDRRLLVHCEQGLGDTLQFVRYLKMVKTLGGTLIFETRKQLIEIFKTLPCIDILIERSPDGNPGEAFDFHVPLMSLPAMFQTTFDTIPADVPYLFAKESMVDKWRNRISSRETKLKVGIVWAGKPGHTNDHNRSCGLEWFAPLGHIPGVQVYSLQKGEAVAQLNQLPEEFTVTNLGEEFIDFEDTAGAIANLDLIISVDTAVAHLAGAMGKPTWVLLPVIPDWRWLLDREDSPWYPTMRLFRQPKTADWAAVFQRVAESLKKLLRQQPSE